jgi:tetratricopeptide (TPR) repeat protein
MLKDTMLRVFGEPRFEIGNRVTPLKNSRETALLLFLALRQDPEQWLAREVLLAEIADGRENPKSTLAIWINRAKPIADSLGFPLEVTDNHLRWVVECEARAFYQFEHNNNHEMLLKFNGTPLSGMTKQFEVLPALGHWQQQALRAQQLACKTLAKLHQQQNQFEQALSLWQRGIAIAPQDPDLVLGGMQCASALGQTALAQRIFGAFVALQERDGLSAPAFLQQAALRLENGEPLLEVQHQPRPLPKPTGTFVGRGDELERLDLYFQNERVRILTIQAIGGQGKTTLALRYATLIQSAYQHGAVWVDLQRVNDLPGLFQACGAGLGLALQRGAEHQKNTERQLLSYLSNKHLLLVLDNADSCEQLETWLWSLCQNAPEVRVIITSRQQKVFLPELRSLEAKLSLSGLLLSDALEWLKRHDKDLDPENLTAFTQLHQIFAGMPMVLEIMINALPQESCLEMLERIGKSNHLDLSLKRLLDSSLAWLEPRLCDGYLELAVLRGSFTQDAAQHIAGLGLGDLNQLVRRSLLQLSHLGRHAWHAVLRDFAEQNLKDNQRWEAQEHQHASYFAAISRGISRGEIDDLDHSEDIEDLAFAWQWWLSQPPSPEFIELGQAAYQCERYTPATRLLLAGLTCVSLSAAQKASAQNTLAWIDRINAPNHALERWQEALRICPLTEPQLLGEIHCGIGLCLLEQGDEASLTHLSKSRTLLQKFPRSSSLARTLRTLTRWYSERQRDLPRAERYARETVSLLEQNGDLSGAARALTNLAIVLYLGDHLIEAEATYRRSNQHYQTLGVQRFVHGYALNQGGLARVAELQNNPVLALSRFVSAFDTFVLIGDANSQVNALLGQHRSHLALGDTTHANLSLQNGLDLVMHSGNNQRRLDVLLHTAEFLATQDRDLAQGIAGYVQTHPASDHDIKLRAEKILAHAPSKSGGSLESNSPEQLCGMALQRLRRIDKPL